jgi:hypothetical protein
MNRTKLGLLGLCAVALGLLAFSAAAQATTGSKWLILNGKGELKEGSTLHAALQFKKDTTMVMHTEILKIKVLFLCTEIKAVNALLQKDGTVAKEFNAEGKPVGSKVLFSGCTTDLNGAASPECTPSDPEDGKGFVVTKLGHALATLHEGKDIVIVLPDSGTTFGTIVLPAGCPIGTSIPVIGQLALQDCENLALTHLVEHLFEGFDPLTKLFSISETAEHATTILGSAWAFLTGEHVGLKFSLSNL